MDNYNYFLNNTIVVNIFQKMILSVFFVVAVCIFDIKENLLPLDTFQRVAWIVQLHFQTPGDDV